jgi:hypothetical protein
MRRPRSPVSLERVGRRAKEEEEMGEGIVPAARGQRRLVLGFDAGCMTCSELARLIEGAVGDRIEVRSLRDPRVEHWRKQALGEDAPWAPTLVEVDGGKVRAWTGLRMGVALTRRIGPSATWRAMQALGDVGAQMKADALPAKETVGMSRGQFLKGVGGAAVAMSVLSGVGNLASPAGAATSTPTQTGGTEAQRLQAWRTVVTSQRFQALNREQLRLAGKSFEFAYGDSWINVSDSYALVALISEYDSRGRRGAGAYFYVDLKQQRLVTYSDFVVVPKSDEAYELSWRGNGVLKERVNVEQHYVTAQDGRRMSPEEYVESRKQSSGATVPAVLKDRTALQSEDPCFGLSLCSCCGLVFAVLGCVPLCAAIAGISAGIGATICAVGCAGGTAILCDECE